MLLFEYILILLFAIFVSNFINRFLPFISVPIIQIVLGICITFLPSQFQLDLNPELFMLLFIAPLLFHDAMLSDKKSLWDFKKPIILLAFGLVLITVIVVGYFINYLIPSIPLAAAFALAAALAPTDAVAVGSLAKKLNMPSSIMNILEGESLVNDASGIVGFQFAIAAMLTGAFSLAHAGARFIIVALGGALVGLVLTLVKYFFVRWIRSLGMENVTLHILIGLLTPFLVFIVAEHLEVSGILAVVVSGIAHSFSRKSLNPETANLNIAFESIWSVLAYTLNGLVFLILGTQLPKIMNIIWFNSSISNFDTISDTIIFTLLLILIRFLWSWLTVSKKLTMTQKLNVGRTKTALIMSLSGVRGAVTLATTMSIPFFLSNGAAFPARDLIIFIASGVILCSLLIANFVLPLLFEKEHTGDKTEEIKACNEILHNVIASLNALATPQNRRAIEIVSREYYGRTMNHKQKHDPHHDISDEEQEIRLLTLQWQRENTNRLLEEDQITPLIAKQYIDFLDVIDGKMAAGRGKKRSLKSAFVAIQRLLGFIHIIKLHRADDSYHAQISMLRQQDLTYVIEKLKKLATTRDDDAIRKSIAYHELFLERNSDSSYAIEPIETEAKVSDIAAIAFQLERDNIQEYYEAGRILRDTAKQMRNNISLLELQMKEEVF